MTLLMAGSDSDDDEGDYGSSDSECHTQSALKVDASRETHGGGGATSEPPDGGRDMRWRAPLCSGARNGQAFGLAKHLTNPADRSGSGQESR